MIELRADDIVTRATPPIELHQFSFYRFNYLCLRAHSVMQSLAIFTRCTFTWNRVSFLNNSKTKNIRWKQSQSTSTPLHCGQQLILLLQNVLPTKCAQFFFFRSRSRSIFIFNIQLIFFLTSSLQHAKCVCVWVRLDWTATDNRIGSSSSSKKEVRLMMEKRKKRQSIVIARSPDSLRSVLFRWQNRKMLCGLSKATK